MLKDGLTQAGDGVFIGTNVYYESEFFCSVRRNGPDTGDGDSFNKLFKSLLRQKGLEISDGGRAGEGNEINGPFF